MNKTLTWAAILFAAALSSCGGNGNTGSKTEKADSSQVRHLRKDIYSPKAEKDVADLKKALGIMRAMDCDSTSSWYYQGAIHWVPDTIPNNPFCASYHYPKDLKDAWDNCTHTEEGKEQIHFLVWHRLYIYHFEKIVRKLSGDPNFSLPYWGYTNTVNVLQNRTLPPIYRNVKSELYEKARLDSLNRGIPISGNMVRRLSLTNLFTNTTYAGFNEAIDRAPHGAMHNYIGFGNDTIGKSMFNPIKQKKDMGGLMQDVNTAAFDPIFWVHHANIDRIWQQWTNTPNGKEVTLAELKSAPWNYTFFDENGKKVKYSMEDVMKIIYNMDYDYDDTPVQGKIEPEGSKNVSPLQLQAKNILTSRDTKVVIKNAVTTFAVANNSNKTNLLKDTKGKTVFMKLTVSFAKPPKGAYEIYLNLPANANANPESDYFSGFMTFFGAGHHAGMQGMNMPNVVMKKTFTYEITKEFNISKALAKPLFNISILKSGAVPQEEIKVENVSILIQ